MMIAHPAAAWKPLLPPQQFADLVEDIRANGQQVPIVVCDGAILDGRNRYAACQEAGVEPRTEDYTGDDPWTFAWSLNAERHHMEPGQKAALRLRWAKDRDDWEAAQRKRHAEANAKRTGRPRKGEERKSLPTLEKTFEPTAPNHAHRELAREAGVSPATAQKAITVEKEAPELFAKVCAGEVTLNQAVKEVGRERARARLDDVSAIEAKAASGVYDVIVIDPPWPMRKIERDVRPNQSEFDYPTMDEDELAALTIPCADAAHVWVWTTHRFLPMALRLLNKWDLKYVCTFVWHKPGGFQPIGLPQYNCEFALYCRRGAPVFLDTKALPACFDAPRGKHSEKPSEFYDVVRRVTAGRRLDMFNRRPIEGFDGWGKETA